MARTKKAGAKTDLAMKYRKQYGPEIPIRTLAKIMHAENEMLFKDTEDARYNLRRIEGKAGEHNRKNTTDKSLYIEGQRSITPYNFPEPESDELEPYRLGWDDFLVAGDFHIPNHRLPPIMAMIRYAEEHGIKRLLINGDLLDNTPFTRWEREPVSGQDVKRWFDQAEQFLRALKETFTEILWLEGNHDYWYTRWLLSKCELLFGDPYYQLENRLHLSDIGITYLDQKNLIKAGKLYISHGHILVKGGGKYAASRILEKTGCSHMINHLHRG
jgi:hypothetical protein